MVPTGRPPSTTRRAVLAGAAGIALAGTPVPAAAHDDPSAPDGRPAVSPTRTPAEPGGAGPPGIAWQRTYGERGDQYVADAAPAHGGGWVLVGEDRGTEHTTSHPWVVSIRADGSVRWQRHLEADPDGLHAVLRTGDGYLVSGDDAWVADLDRAGRVGRETTLRDDDLVRSTALLPIDGGYAFAGIEPTPETATTVVVGVSPDLSPRFTRVYETEYEFRVLVRRDGGLLVGGWYLERGGPWLASIAPDGTERWLEVFALPDWADTAAAVPAGEGLTLAGGDGLVHLDADREVAWARRYEAFADTYVSALARTGDGGYLLAGLVEETSLVRVAGAAGDGTLRWVATYGDTGARIDPAYEIGALLERGPGEALLAGTRRNGATDGWVAALSAAEAPPTTDAATRASPNRPPGTTGRGRDGPPDTGRPPSTGTTDSTPGAEAPPGADPRDPDPGATESRTATVVDDQAGFGVTAAVAGLLAGAGLLARRRD